MLTPLRILSIDPANLGSADAVGVARCDDGLEYALKDGAASPTTPHDELFCTELAQALGIACPPYAVIEDGSGGHYFGSRWEGGVITQDPWQELVVRGDIPFAVVAPVLARVFAFDLFVYNVDRHLGNFLARTTRGGAGLLTMDFSRAWRMHGFPPPPLPMPDQTNTIFCHRELKLIVGDFIDMAVVNEFLSRLAAIGAPQIERIIDRGAPEWISTPDTKAVLDWWGSPARMERIEEIRKGIQDGSYL